MKLKINSKKCVLIASAAFILLLPNSYAYIDPGTGSTIIGSLGPLFATIFATAAAFVVKHFWKPIKKFFKKTVKK